MTLKSLYEALDDIEREPDPQQQLLRYIALRRALERFLIRTTGTL